MDKFHLCIIIIIILSIPTLATVLKSCFGRSAPEEVVAVRAKERSVRSKRAMAPVQRVYSVRIKLMTIKRKIEKLNSVLRGKGSCLIRLLGFPTL